MTQPWRVALLVACAWGWSRPLSAEPTAQARADAESSFREGKARLDAENYRGACEAFAESHRLDPSVGALLNLGVCNEKQGKSGSAWAAYREAESLALTRQDSKRAALAASEAERLEQGLTKVTLRLSAGAKRVAGLRVYKNEVELKSFDLPTVVDPGELRVRAEAPGYEPWSKTFQPAPGTSRETIEIPPLAPKPPSAAPPASTGLHGLTTAGIVVGSLGLAGLAVGGAFAGIALRDRNEAESDPTLCPDMACFPAGREVIDRAETYANVANVTFAVGGAAAASGIILLAVGLTRAEPDAPSKGVSARWMPQLSTQGAALTLTLRGL